LACLTPKDEILYHKCGSPGYVAPEIFLETGYNYKADIFSLASVFYNLLTGMFLFSGKNVQETIRANAICDLRHVKHFLKHTSPQCQSLLCWMLEPDPEARPSAKKALKHPWFSDDKLVIQNLLKQNNLMSMGKDHQEGGKFKSTGNQFGRQINNKLGTPSNRSNFVSPFTD
jgi:serine/threonine protein kinase